MRTVRRTFFLLPSALCLLLVATPLLATTPAPSKKTSSKPKPGSDEFAIESTVLAVYNVISGPAGRRDWNRFKDLFAPGARMISYKNGTPTVMTPDEYIEKSKPFFDQNGFFEWPVETHTERFKDIAQVRSRYESRHATTDEKPFAKGVNVFQFARVGDSWKVLSILWEQEE
jgi:hypothetical protein